MKIKTRLRLTTGISLFVILLIMLSLAWSFREIQRTSRNMALIQEMRTVAFERISLRDDYLLYREQRASAQWHKKTSDLRLLLDQASEQLTTKESKSLLHDARDDFEATASLFSTILEQDIRKGRRTSGSFAFSEAELTLINQVFLRAYSLSDNISRLHELSHRTSEKFQAEGGIIFIVSLLLGILAIIVNSISLDRIISKRLIMLNEGVKIIGGGNLDHSINVTGDDELSALARASNEMAGRLKDTYTSVENLEQEIAARKQAQVALRISYQRQEAILAAVPEIIMEVGNNKVYTWANSGGIEFFGEDVIGKEADFYFEGEQDTYGTVRPLFNGTEDMIYVESWQRRKDGEKRLLAWWCRVLKDKDGNVTGALSSARDITDLKQAEEEIKKLNAELEQRVIDRTAQLAATNKELESFAHSVSHDLRAPLRGIDGWSLALLEDYGEQLDDQARQYLQLVRAETQQMGRLIDGLLKLSRITRVEMELMPIDLTAMVNRIAGHLQEERPERRIEFIIQPGLRADGDGQLLEIAISNLLDNAIKFTGKQPQARIEFGESEVDEGKAFFVRDNGVGFDMVHAPKLFGAFQRLHKTSEFPGTGIGLATVQRIIHRHGGHIWAEAEKNQGATFFFTL